MSNQHTHQIKQKYSSDHLHNTLGHVRKYTHHISMLRQRSYTLTRVAWLRTQLRARFADSFMTSPSWPVRVMVPLPGMRDASTNMISPPMAVHANPMATPGCDSLSACSSSNAGGCTCVYCCKLLSISSTKFVQHVNHSSIEKHTNLPYYIE